MGDMSWYTNDTKKVIWVYEKRTWRVRHRKTPTVYLIDNKGNKYKETHYSGDGVFGGKDFYIVVAEMNGIDTSDEYSARVKAIKLCYSGEPYLSPNLVTNPNYKWKNKAPRDHEGQGVMLGF